MVPQAFSDSQITGWAQDYEQELCAKHDIIADRWSLEIVSGSNEYELPNYVTNIRSVLYMGKELHPKGFTASRMTNDTPFQTAGSIPYEYMASGKGQRVIKLYPTPMDNIPVYTPTDPLGDLWDPVAEEAACIVEFYRTPAYTGDPQLMLPEWCRRYLLKDYICWKNFSSEGPQQDLRATTYYQKKLGEGDQYMKTIKKNAGAAIIHILFNNKQGIKRGPGRPVLPPNYGWPIPGGYGY